MLETKKTPQKQSKISPDIHIDEKFLQDHLRDVRAEMTWRRELEFRLMQFMLIFYPILGAAMIELFKSAINAFVFVGVAAGAIGLIVYATIVVTKRIDREHEAYAELAKQVSLIWTYYGLFETGAYLKDWAILPERLRPERNEYGKGVGYKKTKELIWVTTAAIILILIILAVIKVFVM
jgi:heme/copper-type cytochrome/quinol oxidase subunit 2